MSRIDRVEITNHRLDLDPPFLAAWDPDPRQVFSVTVVRVHDDEGRVGFGAGESMAGIEDYLHLFLGRDPLDLRRHGAVLSDIAFHAGRPWPMDTALWDLAGKIRGEPLWAMLGGAARSIRLYASWGSHRPIEEAVVQAGEAVTAGFGAIKLRLGRDGGMDEDIELLSAVRTEVGGAVEILVDCNQGWRMVGDITPPWSADHALSVAERLDGFDVTWIEEPLHRGDHAGMAWLRERSPVPVAGGEMTRELHELHLLVDRKCLDVYQPDVALVGGFGDLAQFAREVVDRGMVFTPHTWGSGVALVANAHLVAGTVASPILEYPFDPPEWTPERRDFMLATPVHHDRGVLVLGDAPGLGVELEEERLGVTLVS